MFESEIGNKGGTGFLKVYPLDNSKLLKQSTTIGYTEDWGEPAEETIRYLQDTAKETVFQTLGCLLELEWFKTGTNLFFQRPPRRYLMASSGNPMAYLLEYGLRRVESERPELGNDSRYLELKDQLLRDAEGHFREIQATYATVLKTQCHCGGQLEPVDHDFGMSGGTIYDSVIAKCKSCGEAQAFQFPKEGFISEARSAMSLRDYLQTTYGIDYASAVKSDLQSRAAGR